MTEPLIQWDDTTTPQPQLFDPRRARMQQRLAQLSSALIDAWVLRNDNRYHAILNELQDIGKQLSLISDSAATQTDQPPQSPETDTP